MRTFHTNPNKQQKEGSFFEAFLSYMPDLHITKWEKGESPDYILNISKKKVGLEITALVLDHQIEGKPSPAAIRNAQNDCLKKAAQLATAKELANVEVKVNFRSDHEPIDTELATRELVDFVKARITEIDDGKTWHYYESGLKYFKWVSIGLGIRNGREWLSYHRFGRLHLTRPRVNPAAEIQSVIDKKQTKLTDYLEKCDECWLLIGVDEWTAPEAVELTEEIRRVSFLGGFNRLFFLKNIEGRLEELTIEPSQS